MDNERSARQIIERMITDWDDAYTQGSPHGILGHYAPGDRQEQEKLQTWWEGFVSITENTMAQTTIKHFHLDEAQAIVVMEQNSSFCFRRFSPASPLLGRLFLGLMSRFVFVEREVWRTEWRQTQEGWLCHSEKSLSSRFLVRRRTPATEPTQPVGER